MSFFKAVFVVELFLILVVYKTLEYLEHLEYLERYPEAIFSLSIVVSLVITILGGAITNRTGKTYREQARRLFREGGWKDVVRDAIRHAAIGVVCFIIIIIIVIPFLILISSPLGVFPRWVTVVAALVFGIPLIAAIVAKGSREMKRAFLARERERQEDKKREGEKRRRQAEEEQKKREEEVRQEEEQRRKRREQYEKVWEEIRRRRKAKEEQAKRAAEEQRRRDESRKRAEEYSRERARQIPDEKEKHYGSVLELSGRVTPEDVRMNYRSLVKQYHPDKTSHLGRKLRETAEREIKLINEAYEYFRKKYDF